MKNFIVLTLGLSLVLAGCSKDDDEGKFNEFTGTYPVSIDVYFSNETLHNIETDLILTEENGNFKASVNLVDLGSINILVNSLTDLPSLLIESAANTGATEISGYLFRIGEQTININIADIGNVRVSGEDIYIETMEGDEITGYHGFVMKAKMGGIVQKGIAISLISVNSDMERLHISIYSKSRP